MLKQDYPFVFRFRHDSAYTVEELEESYVYFQSPRLLNDPFDCYPNLLDITKNPDELKSFFRLLEPVMSSKDKGEFEIEINGNNFDGFRAFIAQVLNNYIDRFGIACFSITPTNLMMWSHYANFHKGICLQYDVSYDRNAFKNIRPMNYVEEFEKKEFNPLTEGLEFEHLLYTKSKVWRNEYELRVVKQKQGKFNINKSCLKSIIFGMQTTDDYKSKIYNSTRNMYPQLCFFECEPLKDKFGLRFTQIG